MTTMRRLTAANGSFLFVNPDHVQFVSPASKDGVPIVNQSVVKLIDGMFVVEGDADSTALLLSGE